MGTTFESGTALFIPYYIRSSCESEVPVPMTLRTLTVSTASWEWTHEANKQNANKLKSIFISNNSFYLLQLKGCHKQHLIAIYVFFIEESIDARLVWQNIGKKMSSYGAALTIA